jgi:glyoxylase-like metal-dependent hydrolase (beta-lactamase superfamily II)
MLVHTFKNQPIDSNCYVIYDEHYKSCIIIDPGTNGSTEIIEFIDSKKLIVDYVILTHEHFDHIWGVNALLNFSDPIIIASQYCANMVKDRKKNLSLFYDQEGFVISKEIKSIENLQGSITWGKHKIKFIYTPGHSESSISIVINQCLFSGDLMIKGLKTITKLPTGDKNKLLYSLELIKKNFSNRNIVVYPGHGDIFFLDDVHLNSFL